MCAKKYSSENIIRITSDCPFINIEMVKHMINFYKKKITFLSNNKQGMFPMVLIVKYFIFQFYRKQK